MSKHFMLSTAGHVDHGKSSLIQALTHTDPDRLPEEKKRGITIDLGFAHLQLDDPEAPKAPYSIGIVDVPGHEDFVKNMVAGVGSINLALLVVAADDGWMPQTEEHVQILEYLGIKRAVVALTKVDLIDDEIEFYEELVREDLERTALAGSPIVHTSTRDPASIERLKNELLRAVRDMPPPRDIGKPRLPIDRVFTLQGVGRVVTGTLTSGCLQRDQEVLAGTGRFRVRSLQQHGAECSVAQPGTRTALNLVEAHGDSYQPTRGDIVCLEQHHQRSDVWQVTVRKCPRTDSAFQGARRPVRHNIPIRVHHGSGHYEARIFLMNSRALQPGEEQVAELRFEQPVQAFVGDPFILRDWSEQTTLAGGVVLEVAAQRKAFRRQKQKQFLAARAQAPNDLAELVATQIARDHAVQREQLLLHAVVAREEVAAELQRQVDAGRMALLQDWVADAAWWHDVLRQASERIAAFHQTEPERPGWPISQLRALLSKLGVVEALHDPAIEALVTNGHARSDSVIRADDHRAELPPALRNVARHMQQAVQAQPFEPPSRKELCSSPEQEKVARFLLAQGELVEVGDTILMLPESRDELEQRVLEYIRAQGPATASDLRKHLQVSRRIAIPLLERMDAVALTQRQGDLRTIRNA